MAEKTSINEMTSEEILSAIERAFQKMRESSNEKVTFDNEVPYWPGTIISMKAA